VYARYTLQLTLAEDIWRRWWPGEQQARHDDADVALLLPHLHQECFKAKEFEAMWQMAKERVRGLD
jgi:hypothetical protein